MKKKTLTILICIATIGILVLGTGLLMLRSQNLTIKEDTRIYIPNNCEYNQLVDSLNAHNCIQNQAIFGSVARARGLNKHIKPGSYVLSPKMNVIAVVQKLYSGNQTPIRLTITKKRTPEELCQYLGGKLAFEPDSLLAMMMDETICQEYDESKETIIGMFPQNTYEVYWTIQPKALLDRMQKENKLFWENRQQQLNKLGLTRQQVTTIASIVEEETNCNEEKADIASVYLNRYRIGMPLQADPTVKYAVGDFSIQRIKGEMLLNDSPYNTYRHIGLPPGPICIPSSASIDAVLKNKETNYLYFCAKEDFSGRHNFASSMVEHLSNAQKFHKALNERNIH